jgi:Eco57I restriction endonuclease.
MLEPLFYEALANDRSVDNDYYSRFKCKIPFLNGGLFEPLNDYDWTGTDIKIPNDLFSNSIKTQVGDIGTGILDVFDRYNFTVKEDEPLEKEVAVDPEMLGKVFENLLKIKERKDKGAFYTPREIVHYMCQQSLINYLETKTENVPREDIERFIQFGDIALDLTVRSLAQKETYHGKSFVDEKLLIPKSISDNYQKIDKLLQDIKIVDPAVGSGAFPVGMMNEIVKARSILTLFFIPEEQKARTEYNLKRECIENCLYGVDIDQSAVEIAKLRFWLSLIVDEEKKENIQPLPNLDHKIICGNSLLEEFEGIKLFDERLLGEVKSKSPTEVEIDNLNEQISRLNRVLSDVKFGDQRPEIRQSLEELESLKRRKTSLEKKLEKEKRLKKKDAQITIDQVSEQRIKESQIKLTKLRKFQKEFFNEQNRKRKKQLREEIDKIEWELIEATLEEQGNEEALAKLDQYRTTNVKPFFLWKLYFAEIFQRKNPGFDVVIANPPYIRIHKQDKEYKEQIKSSYYSAFKDYDIYILFFEKSLNILRNDGVMTYITPDKYLIREYGTKIRELLLRNTIIELFDVSRADDIFNAATYPLISIIIKSPKDGLIKAKFARTIKNMYHNFDEMQINHQRCKESNLIELIHPDNKKIIDKIYTGSQALSEIISKNQIFCGTPRAKDYHSWQKHISSEKKSKNSLRLLVCSHLCPYNIDEHKKVRTLGLSIKEPYFTNNNAMGDSKWADFKYVPKIIIRGNDTRITATLDEKGSVFIGMYGIKVEGKIGSNYKYLLALLNCKLYQWIFAIQNPSVKIAGDFFSINSPQLLRLPFKEDKSIEKPIINLVDQILNITKDDDYFDNADKQAKVKKLEEEIDELVYELYKLTPEEIEIVEKFNKEK